MTKMLNIVLLVLAVSGADAVSNFRGVQVLAAQQPGGTGTATAPAGATGGVDYISLGLGAGIGAVVAAAIAFFVLKKSAPAKEGDEAEGGEEKAEATEAAAEVVEAPVEEEVDAGKATDYQALLKVLAQKVAQEVGPKLSKTGAVKNVLESRMSSFTDKAKSFLLNEMNGTAGAVLREMDAPETMLLLDWNHAVEANFPPASILIAGVMSPSVLKLMSFHHLLQMVTVGLPVMCLCIAAIIVDWSAPCSIPTVFEWLFTQTALAAALVLGHGALLFKVWLGQRSLSAKAQEMHEKNNSEDGLSHMRDEFVGNTVILQEALLIENGIRHSFWNLIVGVATFAWLITTIWNLVLVAGWTFVPGVVAFHPKAAEVAGGDFCGAWMTVLVLKINILLAVLYLFLNLATVVQWVCDMMIESQGFQQTVLNQAKEMDKKGTGLPVVELLVKAFLLRGGSDTLDSRLSVVSNHKAVLEKEKAAIAAQLAAVQSEITSVSAEEDTLKTKAQEEGGALGAQVAERVDKSADFAKWKSQGDVALEEAEARAKQVQEATTKALEELWEKIMQAVEAAQNSETAKALIAKAHEAEAMIEAKMQEAMDTLQDPDFQKKLMDAANQATSQARDLADQAIAAAKDPEMQKKLNAMAHEAMEKAQQAANDVAAAANDPEKRKQLQEAAQKAMEDAQNAASNAAATIQDPEMQKKMKEAAQNAMDQAQIAAQSAIAAAQDPEMQKKLKEAAQKAMEDAQAAAQKAKEAVNDPELQKKLEEAAKKAMQDAQDAAEQAKAVAQDPEMQKKLAAAAQKYSEQAQKAATDVAAAVQDPEMQKKLKETAQKALADAQAAAEKAAKDPKLKEAAEKAMAEAQKAAAAVQDPEFQASVKKQVEEKADQASAAVKKATGKKK